MSVYLLRAEADVLRPAVVSAVLDGVFEALRPDAQGVGHERLCAELADGDRQIKHLTEGITTGGLLAPLLDALKARQGRQNELRRAIEAAERAAVQRFNRHAIEAQVRERLSRWRGMLTTHVADARQLLRETLTGPIRFAPVHRAYQFAGELSLGALLAGTVGLPTNLVPVRGFEPRSRG